MDIHIPNEERGVGVPDEDRCHRVHVGDLPSRDDVRIARSAAPADDSVRGGELRIAFDVDGGATHVGRCRNFRRAEGRGDERCSE